MKHKFLNGIFGEEIPADIEINAETWTELPCRHCVPVAGKQNIYTVGATLTMWTSGGHDATEVCIDCLLEEYNKIKTV